MFDASAVSLYLTVAVCFAFTVTILFLPNNNESDSTSVPNPTVHIRINGSSRLRNLAAFWKSTGFCPPLPHQSDSGWFLSEDMLQNLKFIGSIPFNGIEQVRIHWLLDSVKYTGLNPQGKPEYNFTSLDTLIERLWVNELRPGFEVMGNPSDMFTDFENITQVWMWRSLVYDLVLRSGEQYGGTYLRSWNFESWNEPSFHHFDQLNFTLQGFYNYYDATVDAVKAYDVAMKIGGPGGSCHDYDVTTYCWGLLNHVVHGTNIVTKEKGAPIDYISIHKKGVEPNNTAVMLEKEGQFYQIIKDHLPELGKLPIYNDEADPLVGWNKDKWWRADVTYAAMVTKIIAEHQNKWMTSDETLNFTLLSNDNGFLSYNPHFFTQRTLLARFQMNDTKPPHVQFIRKPGYSVMGLLSYLDGYQLSSQIETTESKPYVGVLATFHHSNPSNLQDSDQYSVIVYNSADTETVTMQTNITLQLQDIETSASMRVVIYQMDNNHGNPYAVWLKTGKPHTPSAAVLEQMRKQEEPVRIMDPSPISEVLEEYVVNITLPLPGVLLVHLCEHAQLGPGQVTNVSVHNITTGYTLITWSDSQVESRIPAALKLDNQAGRNPGPTPPPLQSNHPSSGPNTPQPGPPLLSPYQPPLPHQSPQPYPGGAHPQMRMPTTPMPPPMERDPGMPRHTPYMGQPDVRLHELNKRLQQRGEESDNLWWDAFATEFFEDEATMTMSFCLEDGPKRYTIGRTLIPRYFRSVFEGGVTDMYFILRHPKESFHNTTITLDCDQALMVTHHGKPMFTKVVAEGRLILEFTFDDLMRIRSWHFAIRQHKELIPRGVIAMQQDPNMLETLSKNITRQGLTNYTLNFLRLCVILEPMQELMSRHKAYGLSPRDCLKTTLFQKWQRMVAPPETNRQPNKRRKRKSSSSNNAAANSVNPGGNMGGGKKNRSPGPQGFNPMPGDVMVVGEPTLMGGEFGDEDERLITRLENQQYEPSERGDEDLQGPKPGDTGASPGLNSSWGQDKKPPHPPGPGMDGPPGPQNPEIKTEK